MTALFHFYLWICAIGFPAFLIRVGYDNNEEMRLYYKAGYIDGWEAYEDMLEARAEEALKAKTNKIK